MRLSHIAVAALVVLGANVGCKSSNDLSKPTQSAVKEFKGNPTAPGLSQKLQAGMGGGPPAPPAQAGNGQ